MPDILPLLDRIQKAQSELRTRGPTQTDDGRIPAIGAPAGLTIGARVRDTISGQDGEVIAYGRATAILPPA